MATNFKPWIDTPVAGQHVQAASVFAEDAQRINGFVAGDLASALRVNSGLRQANVVVAALMQMCDDVVTLPSDLSLLSSVTAVKNAMYSSMTNINNAKSFARVYKSISEFPSFTTSNTLAELCDSMVDNSYLSIDTFGYANLCPTGETDTNGQLDIVKVSANRVRLMWSFQNSSKQPVYIATYRGDSAFLGWKLIFTTDKISTVMPTAGTKSNAKVPSEALFFDQMALKANLANPALTGVIRQNSYPLGTYQMTERGYAERYSKVMSLHAKYGTGTESMFNIELGITIAGPTLSTPLFSKLKLRFRYYNSYDNLQYTAEANELKEELGTFFIAMYQSGVVDIYYKTSSNNTLATATILGISGDFMMLNYTFTRGNSSYDPDVMNGSYKKILYTDYVLNVPTANNFTNAYKALSDKLTNTLYTKLLFSNPSGLNIAASSEPTVIFTSSDDLLNRTFLIEYTDNINNYNHDFFIGKQIVYTSGMYANNISVAYQNVYHTQFEFSVDATSKFKARIVNKEFGSNTTTFGSGKVFAIWEIL